MVLEGSLIGSRVVDDLLWDLELNPRCSTVVSHLKNPSMF